MQLELFETGIVAPLLEDLFQAYFDARRNKRNTINALAFEHNFEAELFELYDEIITRTYKLLPSICFIVNKPVKREVFAANFRDRVIHHLIYNYISPIFEKKFINDCYSCRISKGTHYGINRIDHFIRSCSQNYKKDCYILKLDIKGYFMSMNKDILFNKILEIINNTPRDLSFDKSTVIYLINKTIYNDPTLNCKIKGNINNWSDLPKNKSLFHTNMNCGLPIGNLTSQLFGNIYLNELDHYIKKNKKIKYYGRYVDDFVLIHHSKDYLKTLIPEISDFLQTKLELELHPKKIYLQHYTKGVKYLGVVIKPYRKYIANRTVANIYNTINKEFYEIKSDEILNKRISSLNSYLGIIKHYKTNFLQNRLRNNLMKNENMKDIKFNESRKIFNRINSCAAYSKYGTAEEKNRILNN